MFQLSLRVDFGQVRWNEHRFVDPLYYPDWETNKAVVSSQATDPH